MPCSRIAFRHSEAVTGITGVSIRSSVLQDTTLCPSMSQERAAFRPPRIANLPPDSRSEEGGGNRIERVVLDDVKAELVLKSAGHCCFRG